MQLFPISWSEFYIQQKNKDQHKEYAQNYIQSILQNFLHPQNPNKQYSIKELFQKFKQKS